MKQQMIRCVLVSVATLAVVACKGKDGQVDNALNNDLSLAAQARPLNAQDTVSAAERAAQQQKAYTASQTPAPVHHSTVRHRSSTSETYSSPPAQSAPREHIEKHTGRDAAIGAGAGAVLGAVTGGGVKGSVIGAAAGGVLGAVIGNNVDKKKVPNP